MTDGSDARAEILTRIRAALAGAETSEVTVPRGYRTPTPGSAVAALTGERLLELFTERVTDYRATVTRCRSDELPDQLRRQLAQAATVLVPDGVDHPLPGTLPLVRDTGQSATELDRIDAVVTTATVGVAVTGTIVLDHGPGQGRRALTLIPDTHVCIIRANQVVPDVADAVAALDPRAPQTWISGPSATSDIELDRVEGVHGPRTLHVLLLVD